MKKPVMTEEIASAAARDEGNRSMRAGGRTTWNKDDMAKATAKFYELWPDENEPQ